MSGGHTPGPWVASTPPFVGGHIYTEAPGERGVIVANLTPINERDANARLIAAAPELLAACEALLERYRIMVAADGIECLQAIVAIAKARGDGDAPCTDCDDTGVTHQTERKCSCDAGLQS